MSSASERKTFLFTTWEGGGSVMPILTAARKLADRGHRVRVMSDRCNRFEAEAAGAAFVPWTRAPSRPDRSRESEIFRDWEAPTPQEQFLCVLDRIMTGPARAYAEDVVEELRREPADLVVSNEMLFGVMVGCEAIGQPFALLTCNVSLFPVEGVPPLGPGLPPPRTDEERALHAEIAAANRQMFNLGLPAVNRARGAFGLAPLADLTDQLLAAGRTLLGTSRAFDFAPASLPAHMRYVGRSLPIRPGLRRGARLGPRTTRGRWSLPVSAPPSRTTSACCRTSSTRRRACRSGYWSRWATPLTAMSCGLPPTPIWCTARRTAR